MSENDYHKLKRLIHILIILVIIFVILVLANLVHTRFSPATKSFPAVGPKGDTAEVDYDRIALIIDEKIAALPVPHDGADGRTGPRGNTGPMGRQGVQGVQGIQGPQGEQGPPGISFQYRMNPNNGIPEWRLVGDDSWQRCQPEDGCP